MHSQTIVRLSRFTRGAAGSRRLYHSTPLCAATEPRKPGKDPQLSQGTVSQPGHDHPGDVQDQAARAGQKVHPNGTTPVDAAERHSSKQAPRHLKGNPEGVGFADQVGSQSSSASVHEGRSTVHQSMGGQEESTPPGIVEAVKSKLGMETTPGDVKQNRDGGVGVTGTGVMSWAKNSVKGRREIHWSAVSRAGTTTKGQAPVESRKPKDSTYGEQNSHLKHRSEGEPDHGRGNAAPEPKLPSHQLHESRSEVSGEKQPKRTFMTSAHACQDKDKDKTNHTAESYLKDVDSTPPQSTKTHTVDGGETSASVVRPYEPNESPTGQYSRAGPHTSEYQTVNKEEPYDIPPSKGEDKDKKLRYGNMDGLKAKMSGNGGGDSVSKEREGPQADGAEGHKPEGHQS
ncbi:hypothetical protein OBBRIDRAFT_789159 [Obba rivulosa]|uniref:Uncharacterized protein n=1 Tax=Obba rivulosa TaxID=1052685 RepID=A0A8E2DRP1_9APHY|nr:hypothetical protein OBBRIDRAFT_789159 [Obba rivulosa]